MIRLPAPSWLHSAQEEPLITLALKGDIQRQLLLTGTSQADKHVADRSYGEQLQTADRYPKYVLDIRSVHVGSRYRSTVGWHRYSQGLLAADITCQPVGSGYPRPTVLEKISQAYRLGEDIPGLPSWRRYPRPTVLEKISQAYRLGEDIPGLPSWRRYPRPTVLEKISQAYRLGEDIPGLPSWRRYPRHTIV